MDADNLTNKVKPVEKVLMEHDHSKENLYLHKCLGQRRHFAPCVVTSDGSLGKEARAFHKALSHCLAKQWECLISKAIQFVTTSMIVAILWDSCWSLRESQVPAHTMIKRISLWEDKAGLGFFFARTYRGQS